MTDVLFSASQGTILTANDVNNQTSNINGDINAIIDTNVTHIDSYAFHNKNIISINFHKNIIFIGAYAFANNNISSVILPDSIQTIGPSAFANCEITNLKLPNNPSFNTLSKQCFMNSVRWIDDIVYIPTSVTDISDYVFNMDYNASETDSPMGQILVQHKTYLGITILDAAYSYTDAYYDKGRGAEPINTDIILVPSHFLNNYTINTHSILTRGNYVTNQIEYNNFKINGMNLTGFGKGIMNEDRYFGNSNINYETETNIETMQNAYSNNPFSVMGYSGFKQQGIDIGLRLRPYYLSYYINTDNIYLLPHWTKIGIIVIGGGGGGGSGGSITGNYGWGGFGGGCGGMGVLFINKENIPDSDVDDYYLKVTIGNGGTGGPVLGGNDNGKNGEDGENTYVDFISTNTYNLITANGGRGGAGGWGRTNSEAQSQEGYGDGRNTHNPNDVPWGENGVCTIGPNISTYTSFIDYKFINNSPLVHPEYYNVGNTSNNDGGDAGYINDYIFNIINTSIIKYGRGGDGGRGDNDYDYGAAGNDGTKGMAIIMQYFT